MHKKLTCTVNFKMQDDQPQDIQDEFEFPAGNVWKKIKFYRLTASS